MFFLFTATHAHDNIARPPTHIHTLVRAHTQSLEEHTQTTVLLLRHQLYLSSAPCRVSVTLPPPPSLEDYQGKGRLPSVTRPLSNPDPASGSISIYLAPAPTLQEADWRGQLDVFKVIDGHGSNGPDQVCPPVKSQLLKVN